MVATVLHSRVVNALGSDIVGGRLAVGTALTLEGIQARFDVSRTVAREGMRILEAMHLVTSERRNGIVVQPAESWNVFDRRVIRWRLDSETRPAQLRSLTELRIGIEPFAAHLAAARATEDEKDALRQAAGEMRVFGEAGRLDRYLAADIAFHRTVLRASHNEMYVALIEPVIEAVSERPLHGHSHAYPVPAAMDLHEAVMLAIADGDGAAAESAMLGILSDVRSGIGAALPDGDATAG
ncbi:FadR/GntR family transcriptional regulator [Jiangella asiatica]|uniref:FadR family transcriptional regulator n=1 Tax=Jiangella asiatica TaxID=2530372 RepID=A0A4R5DKT1_9ACTN|nr:FCD domain-containing protein [Jiangella asiatica]TDE11445.1 FadR family transcriptional regulator [Jiangella asiatica]